MHIKYDKAAIDPSLPGILLLSHGDLAIGLMDTVQAVIGTTSNIAAFTLSHVISFRTCQHTKYIFSTCFLHLKGAQCRVFHSTLLLISADQL